MSEELSLLLPEYDPCDQADGYYVDADKAQRSIDFFPLFLKHGKGKWSGGSFELATWRSLSSLICLDG